MKLNTVQSVPVRPASFADAMRAEFDDEMRAAHIAACQQPQSKGAWFVSGMAFGVALTVIVFAVITLVTR